MSQYKLSHLDWNLSLIHVLNKIKVAPLSEYESSACPHVTLCGVCINLEITEKTKQETNEVHSLYGQNPAERRLKSGNCFLHSVKSYDFPPKRTSFH